MSDDNEFNGWKIITGADFRETFFVKDPSLPKIPNPEFDPSLPESVDNRKELFQPKDLTGFTAKMDIRTAEGDDQPLIISLETGGEITLGDPDPADGSVEIFIDSPVTKVDPILAASGKSAFFDFFLIPPDPEDNEQLLKGSILIERATTDV